MNIALFAAGNVGYEVARVFGDNNVEPLCLVLDSKASSEMKGKIIEAAKVPEDRVYYSDELYSKEILNTLEKMRPDLIILCWWPYIIKEPLISLPRHGCLNFHPSLLPNNRGKHYNFWALVEEAPFGVTLHFVDEGVDTGDIAFQSRIETTWEDTGETLYYKAQQEIVRLFKDNFSRIVNGDIPRTPQNHEEGSFHRASELDPASEIVLDSHCRARNLLNMIRARTFPPHPAAWFVENGSRYEVRIEIKKIDSGGSDG
ncbi:MAG: formyltransferase family protein [Nitrospirota bacterium]|nr:formyltransferase family protein [Nitrospirota bacterium]